MRTVLVIALALTATAAAQERAILKPVTMQGNWFANPASSPANCAGDGWFLQFSIGTKKISVSVTQRTGATYSTPITTTYTIAPAPEAAPAKLGLFLSGPNGDVAVSMHNNIQAEWVPAGADKAYSQTSMYLRRC